MGHNLRALAAAAPLLLATTAAEAVPPLQPWPAGVSPPDGGALVANGRLWVFGASEVALADVGVALDVDGAVVPVDLEVLGCCTVQVTPRAELPVDGRATLLANAYNEVTYTFTVVDGDVQAPSVGAVEVVQVLNANVLAPPILPAPGPAWVLTLDVAGALDEVAVAALATFDEDDTLLTVEPAAGQPWERLVTGLHGDRTEGCITVEVWDGAGQVARAAPACVALPPPQEPEAVRPPGGCSNGAGAAWLVLGLLWTFRRRPAPRLGVLRLGVRRHAALPLTLLAAGCAAPPPPSERLCADAFADQTFPGPDFSDAFFDEHARQSGSWFTNKLVVLHLMDPSARRVGLYEDSFYELHDEWFFFRLMNGVQACGAEGIAPYQPGPGESFPDVATIRAWALAQARLPPFLSWREDRLVAHDFYRLARAEEPRVYLPAYFTRDIEGEPGAYAVRISGADTITRDELAALFDTLDPLMPAGRSLYWVPSAGREAHVALAEQLEASGDPLGARVRWDGVAVRRL